MLQRLKSKDLWIGIVAGIIVALAAAMGVTIDDEQVEAALVDVVEQIEDVDTDSE